jgi:hypothetical protein
MLPQKIALIDQTGKIGTDHLAAVAAANQQHVNLNVAKYWPGISATITTMPDKKPVPKDVWPVYIVNSLQDGVGGYHFTNSNNQPYSVVANGRGWMVAVSHEIIEMCIDPFGNRIISGPKVELNGATQFLGAKEATYLVEACDSCEEHGVAMRVSGWNVSVSDFLTPAFFQNSPTGFYDWMGRVKAPFQILPGGYISFEDESGDWWQLLYLGAAPQLVKLGPASGARSLKEFVDGHSKAIQRLSDNADHEAVKAADAMNAATP